MISMSFVACGKKDETKNSTDVKQSDNMRTEAEGDVKTDDAYKDNASAETKVLPPQSASELEDKVDEFNTTDNPERKEELRKELEEFLKQAEEMANQG